MTSVSAPLPTTGQSAERLAARRRGRGADLAFLGLIVLGAVLLLVQMRGLSFFQDDWDFILRRRGFSAHVLLTPHNSHLMLVPILVYKALLAVFGAGSYAPFKALTVLDFVLLAVTVGLVCRSLWGPWWGLVPVALLVTLGASGWTWLLPIQVSLTLATAAGIVVLAAIARGTRAGDRLACAALVLSLASHSEGVGAVAGATVMIALGRDRWQRAWVVAIPALLYGLWYLDYGSNGNGTQLRLWTGVPAYALKSLSSAIAGLTGLSQLHSPASGVIDSYYGYPLAIALLVLLLVALLRGWRPARIVWGVVATLLALWIAACLANVGNARPANVGRYLPVNAAFLLVALCASVPRPRLRRAGGAAACVVVAIICITNAAQYSASRDLFRTASVASRAELGGLLITRGLVNPAFIPGWGPPAFLDWVQAGPYFSAVDAFGSNADSPTELQRAPEVARELSDRLIARAEQLTLPPPVSTPLARGLGGLAPVSGPATARESCLVLGTGSVVVTAPASGVRLQAPSSSGASLELARFARGFSIHLGEVAPGGSAAFRPPLDRAPNVPWRMQLSAPGARVCPLGPGYGSHDFITSVSPVDGGSGIPLNTNVVATFREPMDRASTARGFSLSATGNRGTVAGRVVFFSNRALIFVPNRPLAPATRYTATMSRTAADEAGNHPAGPTAWSFTTAAGGAAKP